MGGHRGSFPVRSAYPKRPVRLPAGQTAARASSRSFSVQRGKLRVQGPQVGARLCPPPPGKPDRKEIAAIGRCQGRGELLPGTTQDIRAQGPDWAVGVSGRGSCDLQPTELGSGHLLQQTQLRGWDHLSRAGAPGRLSRIFRGHGRPSPGPPMPNRTLSSSRTSSSLDVWELTCPELESRDAMVVMLGSGPGRSPGCCRSWGEGGFPQLGQGGG